MSNINFNYDFVAQAQAPQAAQSPAANDPLNFPYAPPSGWSDENSFDISIPTNPDGTINVQALLDKLRKMVYYAQQGDNMDYNSMLDITAYLMEIAQVMPQLKAQGADGTVQQYLNLPIDDKGTTLAQMLANTALPAIIDGTFYKNGGDAAATQAFANQLLASLKELSGSTNILDPILQQAETLVNGLPSWMNSHTVNGKADMSFDDYAFQAALTWETNFTMPDTTGPDNYSYTDEWRTEELNGIFSDPAVAKNPFLGLIMLMAILTDENSDIQTQIGGRGALVKAMTNLGKLAQKLSSQWSAGKFTPDSAQAFFQELSQLNTLSQDKRFAGSISPQVAQVFQDLTNPNGQIMVTFTVATKDGNLIKKIPIGELYQGFQNGTYSAQNLTDGLNSLMPQTTPPAPGEPVPPAPAGFATIGNDIGQISTSVTSASSAQGQLIQNEEGLSEQDLSFITAAANSITKVNEAIVSNITKAGN
jgi:hypothetical protein